MPVVLDRLTRFRVPLTFVAVLLLLKEDLSEHLVPFDVWTSPAGVAGLALVIAGLLLRAWAAGTIEKGAAVTRDGPYALVRHPLYLGSLLIALGFCVILGDGENFLAVGVVAAGIYVPKIRAEEAEMRARHPAEYEAYAREVPAFLPRRFPSLAAATWSLRRYVEHREYRAALTAAAAVSILELIAHGFLFS